MEKRREENKNTEPGKEIIMNGYLQHENPFAEELTEHTIETTDNIK